MLRLASFLAFASVALAGCDELSDFRGDYDGSIVTAGFVRSCFASSTKLSLRFDPRYAVDGSESVPTSKQNQLSTSDGVFDDTPLVPFSALAHDPLGELDFPGEKRLRSYLLLARPTTGPLAGRDATVVISLLEGGGLEARILARTADDAARCPGGDDVPDGSPHAYFGLFRLKRP